MYTVVSEFKAGKYAVLELDRPISEINYTNFRVNGIIFNIVPVYDLPKHIAIEATDDFVGKEVECI